MSASTLGGIALQLVLISVVGFATGELLLRWAGLMPKRYKPTDETFRFELIWVGITERILSALVGIVVFSVALMAAHIVTTGWAFNNPVVVPLAGAMVVALWWRGRVPMPRPRPTSYLKLAALVAGLLMIYALPGFVAGSSVRTGDPPWHLGWTEQLLAGEPVPVGPAPQFGANAYPWGLHATMATMVRIAPGTDSLIALESLHLLLIAGLPIAAACLAFRLHRNAGWLAAAAVALIGGFGWVGSGGPDFITSPDRARYGADLVVASPNSVYELLPPALPRELGVILLGAAGLFAVMAARNRIRRVELLAGFTAGLAGLVSVPMFVSALIWMFVVGLVAAEHRARFIKHTVGGATLVFALWGLPVFIQYIAYGGFVNITPQLGKEWSLLTALASWGLLLPLAALGVALALKQRSVEDRALVAFVTGTAAVLALAILRGVFDWDLWGNATLLHQGRVWPPLHLLGGVFAGAGLVWLYEKMRPRMLAVAMVVALLGIGALSPLFASVSLTEKMEERAAGFIYGGDDFQADNSFIRRASDHLGSDDTLLVVDSNTLAFHLFEFSGVRLAAYDHPNLATNDLRIRYADLAADWAAQMATKPFSPNFVAAPADSEFGMSVAGSPGGAGFAKRATGTYEGQEWLLIELTVGFRE